jgi:hypothetical protein
MKLFDPNKPKEERLISLAVTLAILGGGIFFGYKLATDESASEIARLEGVINGLVETTQSTTIAKEVNEEAECTPNPKRSVRYSGLQCGSREDALSLMNSNSAYYQIQGKACLLALKDKAG